MGLLRSLVLMLLLIWFLRLPGIKAQVPKSAGDLDALLRDYAFRAFVNPRTGIEYGGLVPSFLSGINISALRLRSGSLKRYGVKMYKEFEIPPGVTERPYVERLAFVYQNLGNWSSRYYPLDGYSYLAPVLGLLAYSAANLSATNLSLLNIKATGNPIKIKFPNVKSAPDGSVARCVWFDLQGSPNFSNIASGNECSAVDQGHFSIIAESTTAPSPAPISPAPITPPSGEAPSVPKPEEHGKKNNSKVGIIVGSVVGGLFLLVALSFLAVWVHKLKERKKMQQMERAADVGEGLQMTSVGETKAPSAMVTRTPPTLENEYVP